MSMGPPPPPPPPPPRILEANDEFLRMVSHGQRRTGFGPPKWADLTPPDWRDRKNARIEQQKTRPVRAVRKNARERR